MRNEEMEKREERAAHEPLVITRTEEGFRVYSPAAPSRIYLVSGEPEGPSCTCPDFEQHAEDPDWRCKHILAVLRRENNATPVPAHDGPRNGGGDAAKKNGRPARKPRTAPKNGASAMILKRSVSPDGRIDSLSVELSCPIKGIPDQEIEALALKAMALQAAIAAGFLNGKKAGEERPATGDDTPRDGAGERNETLPATITGVGGMDGRWGRRLYLTIQSNGKSMRLFGSRKQLGERLMAAGYPRLSEQIEEGVRLDVPCRITTELSTDGRYVNVAQVLPAKAAPHRADGR